MCCLMYEHRTYVEARRRFPREGRTIRTGRGEEKVVSVDIWRESVTLRDQDGNRRVAALSDLKQEVGPGLGRVRDRDGTRPTDTDRE